MNKIKRKINYIWKAGAETVPSHIPPQPENDRLYLSWYDLRFMQEIQKYFHRLLQEVQKYFLRLMSFFVTILSHLVKKYMMFSEKIHYKEVRNASIHSTVLLILKTTAL